MSPIRAIRALLSAAALSLFAIAMLPQPVDAQIAVGKSKFLGSTISASAPSTFTKYWNQVTPENAGKWGSVEGTRGVFNWTQLDTAYNFAQQHGDKFKAHNLVWGAQF